MILGIQWNTLCSEVGVVSVMNRVCCDASLLETKSCCQDNNLPRKDVVCGSLVCISNGYVWYECVWNIVLGYHR